jgi:hypothetical protein
MKIEKYNIRGTEMNRIQFSEIEIYLEEKGHNINVAFEMLADEKEFVYVSNGFVNGLLNENTPGEWHHYFQKEGNNFNAGKYNF